MEIRDSLEDLESLVDGYPARSKCPWKDLFDPSKRCIYMVKCSDYCDSINISTRLNDAWCNSRIRMANSIIYEMRKLKEIPQ